MRALGAGAVAIALTFGAGLGAEATLEASAAAIESAAGQPDGDRVVVGHLSRKLGISAEVLRQQRTRSALGWGDVLIANYLATAAKRTFDETVAEHQAGKTWNEVAESHHVPAPELLQYVRESEGAVEQRSEDKGPSGSKTGSAPTHSPGGAGGGSGGGGHRRY
jgi:hypothetical protein